MRAAWQPADRRLTAAEWPGQVSKKSKIRRKITIRKRIKSTIKIKSRTSCTRTKNAGRPALPPAPARTPTPALALSPLPDLNLSLSLMCDQLATRQSKIDRPLADRSSAGIGESPSCCWAYRSRTARVFTSRAYECPAWKRRVAISTLSDCAGEAFSPRSSHAWEADDPRNADSEYGLLGLPSSGKSVRTVNQDLGFTGRAVS